MKVCSRTDTRVSLRQLLQLQHHMDALISICNEAPQSCDAGKRAFTECCYISPQKTRDCDE